MVILRTMLFVPGNNARMIRKAASSNADAIILDLEDAVPLPDKDNAREIIRDLLPWLISQGRKIFVRVNSLVSDLIYHDLEHVVQPGCRGIMLPKTQGQNDIAKVSKQISKLEKTNLNQIGIVSILPLIESAKGVLNVHEIAKHERIIALAFGALDYSLDLGLSLSEERLELLYPRSIISITARAMNIAAIDSPWFDLNNDDGLRRDATVARNLGFQGKMIIHPQQIEIVNRIFSPKDEDIAWAKEVITAFKEALLKGKGVTSLKGRMIDEASYRQAKELLILAETINSKN